MKIRFVFWFPILLLFTVACDGQALEETVTQPVTPAADAPVATPTPAAIPSATRESTREERLTPDATDLPEPIPTEIPETPVTSEAPTELVEEMTADLAQRLDVAVEQITVLRAEEVIWPDGALGCPQPGEVYTQAQVPGYRVTLVVDDQEYNYHANRSGYFVLCEQTAPDIRPPSGTPMG